MSVELLSRKVLPRSLVFSEAGRRLFTSCAALLCAALLALYAGDILRVGKVVRGQIAILENGFAATFLVVVAVFSGFTLLFGMAKHCRNSTRLHYRTLWIIVLVLSNLFGALVYYLAVYRKDFDECLGNNAGQA
jgi:type IV secretory pathway VirB2 component (pilin)